MIASVHHDGCGPHCTVPSPFARQIVLVLFAALGSLVASRTSPDDSTYDIAVDVSPARVAIGGALVLLGARLAGGCTSGHGITGMGHLTVRSLIAVSHGGTVVLLEITTILDTGTTLRTFFHLASRWCNRASN